MNLLGIVLIVLGIWLAIKAVGLLFRLAMLALIVLGAWLLLGPLLGLPTPF